jgi:hypothetical protein
MASTRPGESSAHPADEAQALREEIQQTREHLGDTVEQLAAKADVKKQARAEAARLGERVRAAVARARRQVMFTAAKVAAAGQKGRETVQAGAAQASKTTPLQARHAIDQGARLSREQRGPVAVAAGGLVAALAALIIWRRRNRS